MASTKRRDMVVTTDKYRNFVVEKIFHRLCTLWRFVIKVEPRYVGTTCDNFLSGGIIDAIMKQSASSVYADKQMSLGM